MNEEELDIDLPELTPQQNEFVKLYGICKMSAVEAYGEAYNSKGSYRSRCVEASRLLRNPKITLWLKHIREVEKNHIEDSIKYTIDDAFSEFEDLKIIALESCDKEGRPNIAAANKAVEMKCKLKGLLKDEAQVSNQVVVQMGDVEVDGVPLELSIGDNPNGEATNTTE